MLLTLYKLITNNQQLTTKFERLKGVKIIFNIGILTKLSGILAIGACLLERPGDGENKKNELKELVYSTVGHLKIPFFDKLLDLAIDIVVGWLNKTLWKTENGSLTVAQP